MTPAPPLPTSAIDMLERRGTVPAPGGSVSGIAAVL
jgi:hypothetical protein